MPHGATWTGMVDAFLDERTAQDKERQAALDALTELVRTHPHLEHDEHLTTARMSLLR